MTNKRVTFIFRPYDLEGVASERNKMAKVNKEQRVVARCTDLQKKRFIKEVIGMGWKDSTAFMTSVLDMVNTGKLRIQAPEVPTPTVTFTE